MGSSACELMHFSMKAMAFCSAATQVAVRLRSYPIRSRLGPFTFTLVGITILGTTTSTHKTIKDSLLGSLLYRKIATADNCVPRVKGSEHAEIYRVLAELEGVTQ
jgi:hypothetical protein